MQFARSFFFLISLAMAIPVVAADGARSAQPSLGQQTTTAVPGESVSRPVLTPFGMLALKDHPLLDTTRPVVARSFTRLTDAACLTLRVYKVKRTERLVDNESGMRGYTTCEMTTNYQYRSAVAHSHDVGSAINDAAGK